MNDTADDHAEYGIISETDCFHIWNDLHVPSSGAAGMIEGSQDIKALWNGLERLQEIDRKMSIRMWRIILYLYMRGGPVQTNEIQEALGLPASTLSRMLSILSGVPMPSGSLRPPNPPPPLWVELHNASEDRRRTVVDLTPNRREAIDRVFAKGVLNGG